MWPGDSPFVLSANGCSVRSVPCIWGKHAKHQCVQAQRTRNQFKLALLFSLVEYIVLVRCECGKNKTDWVLASCFGSEEERKASISSIIPWSLTSRHIQWENYPPCVPDHLDMLITHTATIGALCWSGFIFKRRNWLNKGHFILIEIHLNWFLFHFELLICSHFLFLYFGGGMLLLRLKGSRHIEAVITAFCATQSILSFYSVI